MDTCHLVIYIYKLSTDGLTANEATTGRRAGGGSDKNSGGRRRAAGEEGENKWEMKEHGGGREGQGGEGRGGALTLPLPRASR